MKKRVHIIINPAAGQDAPILSQLNKTLRRSQIDWSVSVTHRKGDAYKQAQTAQRDNIDIVAAYGGDGTVMEVAQALFQSSTPLAILPGGTANVMAKELFIPTDIILAIELLKSPTYKKIDMATVNNTPFILRISTGIFADIVKYTDRAAKNTFGQLAYAVSAVQRIGATEDAKYHLTIDGRKKTISGSAIVVANAGNIGIPGMSFLSEMSVDDGKLDVIVARNSNLLSMLRIAQTTLMQQKADDVLKHWQGSAITIEMEPGQSILCDDRFIKDQSLHIQVFPKSISVVVPQQHA